MERSNWRKRVAPPVHVSNAFKMGQIWKVSIETKVDASMYTCSSRTSSSPLRTPILCAAHGLMHDFDIFKGLWKFAGKSKLSFVFLIYQAQPLSFLLFLSSSISSLLAALWLYDRFCSFSCIELKIYFFTFLIKLKIWPDRLCSRAACFVAAQNFLQLEIQLQKSFRSCQFPQNQRLCNAAFSIPPDFQRNFRQNMLKLNLKVCLRKVKSAWQAVRWSRRSRLSRGFDFSPPDDSLGSFLPSHSTFRWNPKRPEYLITLFPKPSKRF